MDTALLIIDMQIGLVVLGYQAKGVLACVSGLIRRARAAGVSVIHVRHHHATYAPLMAGAPTCSSTPPSLQPRAKS